MRLKSQEDLAGGGGEHRGLLQSNLSGSKPRPYAMKTETNRCASAGLLRFAYRPLFVSSAPDLGATKTQRQNDNDDRIEQQLVAGVAAVGPLNIKMLLAAMLTTPQLRVFGQSQRQPIYICRVWQLCHTSNKNKPDERHHGVDLAWTA